MLIKNKKAILGSGDSQPKRIALELFEVGINSVLPSKVIPNHLKLESNLLIAGEEKYNLTDINKVIVLGAGKASLGMAQALQTAIGSMIDRGLIITPLNEKRALGNIKVLEGSHPIPNPSAVQATQELLKVAKSANEEDLIILLLSGGGSSLLTLPVEGIQLKDVKKITQDLLATGASIEEINIIRKQLSKIKGGKLARAIHPAQGLALIISDVVGDDLRYIASGPITPEDSTRQDALNLLKQYGLDSKKHSRIVKVLTNKKPRFMTVNRGEFRKYNISNQVIASNETALSAMAKKAETLDVNPLIISSRVEGESKEVGKMFGQLALSIYKEGHPLSKPALLLSGGETTVDLTEDPGLGGPNQEFALAGGLSIRDISNTVIGAIDSDGEDGSTKFAGGLVVSKANATVEQFASYLETHNSAQLLKKLNGAIITGPTGTNVNDLRLALII